MEVFIISTENSAILMELLKSVKYMVDTSISEAPYDKTVTGLIVGGSSKPKHYHVIIKGKTYDLPCYISNKFKPNTPVSVMIPENNMDFAFIYGVLGGEDGSGTGTVENAKRAEYAVSAGYANTVAVATEVVVGGLLSSDGKNHVTVSPTGIATVTDVDHADNADNATNAVNATSALNANHANKADSADIADTVKNVPIATDTKVGGIKSGTGIGVVNVADDGTATVELPPEPEPYVLPIATETVLGGIYSSTGPGHVVVNPDGTAVVPDAGGIKEIPIATEESIGGVLSSQESGKLNVNSETGISTINDAVLISESGKFTKPDEWGEGPWELVCTEDDSLDENNGLPTGGTTGQYLVKKSDDNYDVTWETLDLVAENITYDNTTSGIVANNVQKAIDELNSRDNSISSQVSTNIQDITENAANIALHHTEIIENKDNISNINERITYYSNRNLLINSDFRQTINQRGKTSYTNTTWISTIDSWKIDSGTLTVNSGYINYKTEVGYVGWKRIQQVIEDYFVVGIPYTFSILARVNSVSGTARMRFCSYNSTVQPVTERFFTEPTTDFKLYTLTYMPSTTYPNFIQAEILINNNENSAIDIDIMAVKVEIGTQQTLAHQDANGAWVLNEFPPNYQQELAKCQRYMYAVNPTGVSLGARLGFVKMDGGLVCNIITPVTMRTRPSINSDAKIRAVMEFKGDNSKGTVVVLLSDFSVGYISPTIVVVSPKVMQSSSGDSIVIPNGSMGYLDLHYTNPVSLILDAGL